LKYSVGEPGVPDWDNFRRGLQKSRVQSLLKNLFQVRINEILKGLSKKENHDFLSGLLIGAELQPLVPQDTGTIVLMGNDAIRPYYRQALEYLGIGEKLLEVPTHIYDLSALTGQWLIYQIQTKTA
jgi:2-dehydro-3-deoxygalactonokinase